MTTSVGTSLDVAGQVLDVVRRAAGPSAEAEVSVDHVAQSLTRFANSFIHQNMTDSVGSVRLRLHVDGRTAAGSSTVTSPEGLRELVDRVVEAARLCPPDPQWAGLTPPSPVGPDPTLDEATAFASPDERAARVRAFVDAGGGLDAAGYCATALLQGAFANSAGQAVASRAGFAAMDAIVRGGSGRADGVARLASAYLGDIDGAALGARAAAKARASADAVELPPGRYEVVLEPTAARDLLMTMAYYGFNGKAVNEGYSFIELGAAQFDPAITIVDDYAGPGAGGALPFDAEGTPRGRVTFVEHGLSVGLAHDRRTAAVATAAGRPATSTGHAVAGDSAFGAFPVALGILPSPNGGGESAAVPSEVDGPAADSDVAALVSHVERGLLVTDLWYTRVLDPRALTVTGLTRNGVWLIEDGKLTSPVQNMRFTQSYPQALAPGAVLGVGTHAVNLPAEFGPFCFRVPALRLASWNCTGNASG
jgi:predicted Zn-dependent protease